MQAIDRKAFLATMAAAGMSVVSAGLMQAPAFADEAEAMAGGSVAGAATGDAAASYPDIMLGVFTNSENDSTDTFYVSQDGVRLQKISQAFKDLTPGDPTKLEAQGSKQNGRDYNLYCFKCPSLIYHEGLFWMLSNEANSGTGKDMDGTLRLVVSASKDLVHWCDQRQVKVKLEGNPVKTNGTPGQFDVVAADWAVDQKGQVWVVASLGYYGAFHWDPVHNRWDAENDTMYPYIVKLNQLEASASFDPAKDPKKNWPGYLNITPGKARYINLPEGSSNRIDGSFYFEGGASYLVIKRDGKTNEIWRADNLDKPGTTGNWHKVCPNIITGFEAPSIAKLGSKYYCYTDHIATFDRFNQSGTFVQSSSNLRSGWSRESLVQAFASNGAGLTVFRQNNPNGNGPRHGTMITVTDPAAKKIVWERRAAAGWPTKCSDVFTSTDHLADIKWLISSGISAGWSDGTFRGFNPVARCDMAAFLFRLAVQKGLVKDSWQPSEATKAKFTDVNAKTDHAREVWWLAEAAISGGWGSKVPGKKEFRPYSNVARQDMAAFLFRFAKLAGKVTDSWQPTASTTGRFTDVTSKLEHANEVWWLAETGVSTGWGSKVPGKKEFRPNINVARMDMAAFLHRMNDNVLK